MLPIIIAVMSSICIPYVYYAVIVKNYMNATMTPQELDTNDLCAAVVEDAKAMLDKTLHGGIGVTRVAPPTPWIGLCY